MFRLKIIYKEVKLEFKMFVKIFLIGTVTILQVTLHLKVAYTIHNGTMKSFV